jgi:valyl-tRNA synthetase
VIPGPDSLPAAADDLRAVGRIARLEIVEADEIEVREVVLAEQLA